MKMANFVIFKCGKSADFGPYIRVTARYPHPSPACLDHVWSYRKIWCKRSHKPTVYQYLSQRTLLHTLDRSNLHHIEPTVYVVLIPSKTIYFSSIFETIDITLWEEASSSLPSGSLSACASFAPDLLIEPNFEHCQNKQEMDVSIVMKTAVLDWMRR